MDQTEYRNLQNPIQFLTSDFLKRVTQLLLSVSVFSFFVSYSSWYSFFLQSLKFQFSTFSFQLLSHTMDKNCIFLISNVILVFLAKTSGFTRFLQASNLNDQLLIKKTGDGERDGLETDLLLNKEVSLETTGSLEEEEFPMEDKEQEAPSRLLNTAGGVEEEKGRGGGGIPTTENEENEEEFDNIGFLINEEEEEEENGLVSIEELNKIFDDFIRRKKEEIRIEAQQQLVMAQ